MQKTKKLKNPYDPCLFFLQTKQKNTSETVKNQPFFSKSEAIGFVARSRAPGLVAVGVFTPGEGTPGEGFVVKCVDALFFCFNIFFKSSFFGGFSRALICRGFDRFFKGFGSGC